MGEKRRKSPQQKKALSLKRDRRNMYGNSNKAARKVIPLLKAKANRKNRHKNNLATAHVDRLGEAELDIVESTARQDVFRRERWRKYPDEPLEEVITRRLNNREARIARKLRERSRDLTSG